MNDHLACSAGCVGRMRPHLRASDGITLCCPQCGSLRIVDAPTPDPIAYGQAYAKGADAGKSAACAQVFTQFLGDRKKGRLLDLGCGSGVFMNWAAAQGWDPTGLDLDPNAVRAVEALGFEAVCGPADRSAALPALQAQFDVVTAFDLIEHVDDPHQTIQLVASVLRPGGVALVVTPDSNSIFDTVARAEYQLSFGRSKRILDLCLNRYHQHRFSSAGLAAAFEREGLSTQQQDSVALYSLGATHYGAGFAPGIKSWTGHTPLDQGLSRIAFSAITLFGIKNKIVHIATKPERIH